MAKLREQLGHLPEPRGGLPSSMHPPTDGELTIALAATLVPVCPWAIWPSDDVRRPVLAPGTTFRTGFQAP